MYAVLEDYIELTLLQIRTQIMRNAFAIICVLLLVKVTMDRIAGNGTNLSIQSYLFHSDR